ncbi:hypothetical protein TNCV_327211 [Trichonephila clavipes]|nr:hypothetical protein TNCV_327211 [Trichonephila clavipes]
MVRSSVRSSDSRPEGLRSIPDAPQIPSEYTRIPCLNCGGGDRWCSPNYRPFGESHRANSYCHLYGAQGHRQAYF